MVILCALYALLTLLKINNLVMCEMNQIQYGFDVVLFTLAKLCLNNRPLVFSKPTILLFFRGKK